MWSFNPPSTPKKANNQSQILKILFPELEPDETHDGTKFLIDTSVDSLLESVLIDLQEGINDTDVHARIGDVIDRLTKIRRMTQYYSTFDVSKYSYIIVDTVRKDPDVHMNEMEY